MVPFDVLSCVMSAFILVAVRPDLFSDDPMNVVIAVASPVVPAVDDIMVPPPIMPPPMPPMVMDALPIIPFMTPSDASLIMAVISAAGSVIPMVSAY